MKYNIERIGKNNDLISVKNNNMNNNKHEFGIGANTNDWSQCKDEREERGVSFIDWLQH